MKYTVLGATGFIGRHLVAALSASGHDVWAPGRDDDTILRRPLGHAIYCIGLTADWRRRPHDTVRAHVIRLQQVVEEADFSSLLYLSSTRVYRGASSTDEGAPLLVRPDNPDDLFAVSKLMGESLCLGTGRKNVRVARVSNVYGPDFESENFLPSIVRDALRLGRVVLRSDMSSEKDFVPLSAVVALLPQIAQSGTSPIYNVANGTNCRNDALLARLSELTGCAIEVEDGSPILSFPPISVRRIQREFGHVASSVVEGLEGMVREFLEGVAGERQVKPED